MKKNLIKAGALAVSAAMLLSGCYPSMLLPEKPSYYTSSSGSSLTPPPAGNTGTAQPDVEEEGRGTQLSFNDLQLEINRIEREQDVPMGDSGMWTVFVYLCGTELETEDGAATADMEEMQ